MHAKLELVFSVQFLVFSYGRGTRTRLIEQSLRVLRPHLLTGARTLCHFVTLPALQGVTLYTREALKVHIYAVFNVTNQSEIPALLFIRA